MPDQVIANEYLPGQGISAHVDCEPCFGEVIASLSLLSACEMRFGSLSSGETRAAILPPRSLLLLAGPAPRDWTHAIPARRSDVNDGLRVMRQAAGVADVSDDAVLTQGPARQDRPRLHAPIQPAESDCELSPPSDSRDSTICAHFT